MVANEYIEKYFFTITKNFCVKHKISTKESAIKFVVCVMFFSVEVMQIFDREVIIFLKKFY